MILPRLGEVLHFSEDPTITVFAPHVPLIAQHPTPYVWAVDAAQAPAYWFPRDCPRAMAWVRDVSNADDVARIIGPGGGGRVHAVEYGWLDWLARCRALDRRLWDMKAIYGRYVPTSAITVHRRPAAGP